MIYWLMTAHLLFVFLLTVEEKEQYTRNKIKQVHKSCHKYTHIL